jgi:hypothetical protein
MGGAGGRDCAGGLVGLKRFVFGSDIHGDMSDPAAVNAFLGFVRDFKPNYRICGGDVFDFRPLRGKASEEERRESLLGDFEAGDRFLDAYRPTHLLRGNHDERLWDRAGLKSGPVSDLAQELVGRVERRLSSATVLPYHRRTGVLRLGHLKFLHGFYAGVTAARQHALAYGSCLFGHVHSIDEASVPGLDRRVARSVGCLCLLDMPYDARSVGALRHCHGWAYGVIDEKTGNYSVFQAEGIDGKFYVADQIRAVA